MTKLSAQRRSGNKVTAAAFCTALGVLLGGASAAQAQVTFGAPILLKAGVAQYEINDPSGLNRWGDYSATTLDPTNANSFWTIQEFVSAENVWSTQITQITVNPGGGAPTIGANFTGSNLFQSGYFPPDTDGAIGVNHFVELINGRYAVYNRAGTLVQSASLDQFWTDAVGTTTNAAFDPRVLYDPFSNRWYAVAANNAGAANSNYLLAVSNTSDPTAGWKGYVIKADPEGDQWADFPMLGYDAAGVYLSGNMFPVDPNSTDYRTSIIYVEKADLLAGTLTTHRFDNIDPNITGFTPQPILDQDNTGLPAVFLSDYNTPAGVFGLTSINSASSGNAVLVGINPFNGPPTADQPGTAANIDASDGRLPTEVVRQNGFLWGVQGVDVGGRVGMRWFQIDEATATRVDEGVITDPTRDFYFGSLAINPSGDIVIGFTASSATEFASSYAVVGKFAPSVAAPEPSSLALLALTGTGFIGTGLIRRRKRNRRRAA